MPSSKPNTSNFQYKLILLHINYLITPHILILPNIKWCNPERFLRVHDISI
jgi:hypothetical protein